MTGAKMTFGKYLGTYIGLLLLTGLTFGLSFVSVGGWEWPLALGIALVKAGLVAAFFMHLVEMSAAHRLAGAAAAVLLAILILLAVADVATRPEEELGPAIHTAPFERDHAARTGRGE